MCQLEMGCASENVYGNEVGLGLCYIGGPLGGVYQRFVSQNWVLWAKVYVLVR